MISGFNFSTQAQSRFGCKPDQACECGVEISPIGESISEMSSNYRHFGVRAEVNAAQAVAFHRVASSFAGF
jgi:hypothetical protein